MGRIIENMPAGIYKRTEFHLSLLAEARKKAKTPEAIEKMRKKKIGLKMSPENRRKLLIANIGKTISEEHKEALRRFHTGRKHTPETKLKIRLANLGKKRPLCSGENHPCWKGGVTPLYKKIRKSPEYILWRTSVFERDNYTCTICGLVGGKLNADHIKPFALYPELRLSIDNGRTLCEPCHKKTPTWGGSSKKKIEA